MNIYASLFHNCGDAVVIANQQAQIIFANHAAQSLFQDDLSIASVEAAIAQWSLTTAAATDNQRNDLLWLLKDVLAGHPVSNQHFMLRSPSGSHSRVAITGHRFTRLGQAQAEAMLIIRTDSNNPPNLRPALPDSEPDDLAGLINHARFMERAGQAIAHAQYQSGAAIALICIGLKQLKAVNNTLGYAIGDALLTAVAERLAAHLRATDTLSRLGGDKFAVLVENIDSLEDVDAIAEILCTAMRSPFLIQGHHINTDIKLGISISNTPEQTAVTLLQQASIALNRAKEAFDQKYFIFQDSMKREGDYTLKREADLQRAIENQEFYLEYQPIFLIRTYKIVGMESLVRWQHPEKGPLPPSEFIPLAEKTGLIIPLGWWVLEESCRQLKHWQDTIPEASSLFVSVNVSSKQFSQKNVLEKIKGILERVSFDPKSLKIEITEGVLIENPTSIIEVLNEIRAIGIKLSIDDFGTGYSSLSYLHKFPFDTLKIDRSFLENADSDFEKLEILQSMVRLAWNLGLEVVAEGIETQRHLAQIKSLRCESGQGFLFSKPLNSQAMESLLRGPEIG